MPMVHSELERIVLHYYEYYKNDNDRIMEVLTKNPTISLKFIETHPELNWYYSELHYRNDITPEFIERNMCKGFNFAYLFHKNILDINFVLKHKNSKIRNYEEEYYLCDFIERLYDYDCFKLEDIICNMDKIKIKFNIHHITRHPEFDLDLIIKRCPELFDQFNVYDWCRLSSNKNITIKHIEAYPELPWDYLAFLHNKNNSNKYVEKYFDKLLAMTNEIGVGRTCLIFVNTDRNGHDFIKGLNEKTFVNFIDKIFEHNNWNDQFSFTQKSILYSRSNYISIEYIKLHPEYKWDYIAIGNRMSELDIINNIDLPWKFNNLPESKITRNLFNSIPDKYLNANQSWAKERKAIIEIDELTTPEEVEAYIIANKKMDDYVKYELSEKASDILSEKMIVKYFDIIGRFNNVNIYNGYLGLDYLFNNINKIIKTCNTEYYKFIKSNPYRVPDDKIYIKIYCIATHPNLTLEHLLKFEKKIKDCKYLKIAYFMDYLTRNKFKNTNWVKPNRLRLLTWRAAYIVNEPE